MYEIHNIMQQLMLIQNWKQMIKTQSLDKNKLKIN